MAYGTRLPAHVPADAMPGAENASVHVLRTRRFVCDNARAVRCPGLRKRMVLRRPPAMLLL
eukprot:1444878-Rhodomonas_salina.6